MAEIQKLEEEREREAKMRRDIQEAAQARARQEEEARRQQVPKLVAIGFDVKGAHHKMISNF